MTDHHKTALPSKHPVGFSPAQYRRKMRIKLLIAGAILLCLTVGLVLFAFNQSIVFFHGPGDIKAGKVEVDRNFRLGGLVENGTVQRDQDGQTIRFWVEDGVDRVEVAYKGILPDLFREGQGVVTLGKLDPSGVFIASEVLAKHDENYMPAEAVEAMKKAGTWKGSQ